MHCHADGAAIGTHLLRTLTPMGLSPATVKQAYGWSTDPTAGAGRTIAIVDAFDDRTAAANLATFSQTFGLPACTTANGCFTKVNQTDGTIFPHRNAGWAMEASLDVQWAHAIAPGAKILLVEAKSTRTDDLYAAVDYAKAHAQYVSMSWGGGEYAFETFDDAHFVQPGVSFFAAAGDAGASAEYPSASPNVVSVGGTTLHFDSLGNFTSETGWSDGGGGCSQYELAASAQQSFLQGAGPCAGSARSTPDFSLDADVASGVSVYYTSRVTAKPQKGWIVVGGTSVGAPLAAARAAATGIIVNAGTVYGNTMTLRDITQGNNGKPCTAGYDLCTGRGSWIGATP